MTKLPKISCPVAKVAFLLSDPCTILILRDLVASSPKRFTDLHAGDQAASTRTLTLKLKRLVELEIIRKVRDGYKISAKGLALKTVLEDMAKCGQLLKN